MFISKPSSWNSFSTFANRIAFAENGRPDMFNQFMKDNNTLRWRPYRSGKKDPPPYHDHGRTYQIRFLGRVRQIHVFHEYTGPNKERWDEIYMATQTYASEHNKVAEIYDASHSWYYNDKDGIGTVLIIIHDPDVNVKVS